MKQAFFIAVVLCFIQTAAVAAGQMTILNLPVYRSAGQFWLDKDGKLQGFRLKVLDALNSELAKDNIEFRYKLTELGEIPINRCISDILDGTYEAYFGLIYSKKREEMGLIFSHTEIYSIPAVVWMNRAKTFDYSGPASFQGKRVGVVIGYPYLKNSQIPGIKIEQARDDETNVKLLVMGRIDAIVDNIVRTGTVIQRLGVADQLTYAQKPFSISKFHIAYNKNVSKDIQIKTDAALTKLHESGTIEKIMNDNQTIPLAK